MTRSIPKTLSCLVAACVVLAAGAASASAADVTFHLINGRGVRQVTQVEPPHDFSWDAQTDADGVYVLHNAQAGDIVGFDRDHDVDGMGAFRCQPSAACTTPEHNGGLGFQYTVQAGDLGNTVTVTLPNASGPAPATPATLGYEGRAVLGRLNRLRARDGRPMLQDSTTLNLAADAIATELSKQIGTDGHYTLWPLDTTVVPVDEGWPMYLAGQDWQIADAPTGDIDAAMMHWDGDAAPGDSESASLKAALVDDQQGGQTVEHDLVGFANENGVSIIYETGPCTSDRSPGLAGGCGNGAHDTGIIDTTPPTESLEMMANGSSFNAAPGDLTPEQEPHFAEGTRLTGRHLCQDEPGGSGVDRCFLAYYDGEASVDGNGVTATLDTSVPGEHTVDAVVHDIGGNGLSEWFQYYVDAPARAPAGPTMIQPPTQTSNQNLIVYPPGWKPATDARSAAKSAPHAVSSKTVLSSGGIASRVTASTPQIDVGQITATIPSRLIGNAGGTLIGNCGGCLIGSGGSGLGVRGASGAPAIVGGYLISDQGAGLIGNAGGTLIGNCGGCLNLISDQGSGVINAGGANVINAGGANFGRSALTAGVRSRARSGVMVLGDGSHVFAKAGKAKLKTRLNRDGKKLLKLYRAYVKAEHKRHRRAKPMTLTLTYVVVPPAKRGTAVYTHKNITIKP